MFCLATLSLDTNKTKSKRKYLNILRDKRTFQNWPAIIYKAHKLLQGLLILLNTNINSGPNSHIKQI